MFEKKDNSQDVIDEIISKEQKRYNELFKICQNKNYIFMMFCDALHNARFNNINNFNDEEFRKNFFNQLSEVATMIRLLTAYGDKNCSIQINEEEMKQITKFLDKDFRNLIEKFELIDEKKLRYIFNLIFELNKKYK